MNPWTYVYVIAGAWSIFTVCWAMALDALELHRWARHVERRETALGIPAELPPRILGSRVYAGAIALLIGLWLAAAMLR